MEINKEKNVNSKCFPDRSILLIILIPLIDISKNHGDLILKFSDPKDLENSFPAFDFQLDHDTCFPFLWRLTYQWLLDHFSISHSSYYLE